MNRRSRANRVNVETPKEIIKTEKKVEAPVPVEKKLVVPAPIAELTTKQLAQAVKDGIVVIAGISFRITKAYGKNILLERNNYK